MNTTFFFVFLSTFLVVLLLWIIVSAIWRTRKPTHKQETQIDEKIEATIKVSRPRNLMLPILVMGSVVTALRLFCLWILCYQTFMQTSTDYYVLLIVNLPEIVFYSTLVGEEWQTGWFDVLPLTFLVLVGSFIFTLILVPIYAGITRLLD